MGMDLTRTPAQLALLLLVVPVTAVAQATTPDPETPREIEVYDTVFLEEMTWLEVRDAMRAGKTTAIIPTGGIEQNGPYLALGKHNYILRATTDRIARILGDALVAPIVPFVPEGNIEPPSGHMLYPGTISVTEETFRALLTDIACSLKTHGFLHIILIGDSGGNQDGMRAVADQLSAAWSDEATSIHYIPEYYDNPLWNQWLELRGIQQVDEGLHDDVRHSAIMMTVDPTTVRMEQRLERGLFSINGVALEPANVTIELGNDLVEYQATVTANAIRMAIGG
jgi:creatinine amidohydrolase/Fe(II)-dependent formamide hydrolase-like protein